MNIVFFGSSSFAVPALRLLLENRHKISCVVTQPDRQRGRGLHLEGTVIKKIALEAGLRLYQPIEINTLETVEFLQALQPDLFVVISYGQILSQAILDIPKIMALNVHASLLPLYRGAAPINWAIIRGEAITGITVMKITARMDTGPIILQKEVSIRSDDNAVTLSSRLSNLGAEALLEALNIKAQGDFTLMPQDSSRATTAPKLTRKDGLIHWNHSANSILNLIRGCFGWPSAYTYYDSKLFKIYEASIEMPPRHHATTSPGQIIEVSKEGIVVVTGEGDLIIKALQIEGKRIMKAEEFISGHRKKVLHFT